MKSVLAGLEKLFESPAFAQEGLARATPRTSRNISVLWVRHVDNHAVHVTHDGNLLCQSRCLSHILLQARRAIVQRAPLATAVGYTP
jgi:hypothetical protein